MQLIVLLALGFPVQENCLTPVVRTLQHVSSRRLHPPVTSPQRTTHEESMFAFTDLREIQLKPTIVAIT